MDRHEIDKKVKSAGILAFIICGASILMTFAGLEYMIVEALLAGFCGYFTWKKYSRVASTILFIDHALGVLLVLMSGQITGAAVVIKAIILFVLWGGMQATYEYHKPVEITAELVE